MRSAPHHPPYVLVSTYVCIVWIPSRRRRCPPDAVQHSTGSVNVRSAAAITRDVAWSGLAWCVCVCVDGAALRRKEREMRRQHVSHTTQEAQLNHRLTKCHAWSPTM